jgi:hypothetical protein
MKQCHAWLSMNLLSVTTVGTQLDFNGFLYQSVNVPVNAHCTCSENCGLPEVNFVT